MEQKETPIRHVRRTLDHEGTSRWDVVPEPPTEEIVIHLLGRKLGAGRPDGEIQKLIEAGLISVERVEELRLEEQNKTS